ncbi:uncharacterized protein LOC143880241 [Tasmannia lanceolata]|uniref:uncharacterized protein LOC143880241 n=1 Tax=Tasmannia lanceolata TaxID=3420 RepID=UPI0040637F87
MNRNRLPFPECCFSSDTLTSSSSSGSSDEENTSEISFPPTQFQAGPCLKTPNPDSNTQSEEDEDSENEDEANKPSKSIPTLKRPAVTNKSNNGNNVSKRRKPSNEDDQGKVSKRLKAYKSATIAAANGDKHGDHVDKPQSRRVWSEKDEIILLEGIVEFMKKDPDLPWADMSAFHLFIQNSIHFNFSHVQLINKIRRLKWKYKKMVMANKGKNPVFMSLHQKNSYTLCKNIWGTNNKAEDTNNKAKDEEPEKKPHEKWMWSHESEIVLLNGIVKFMNKSSNLPWDDMPTFYHFLKKSIRFEFSQNQLSDKIRWLKWKYKKMRTANKGEDPVFSKPHKKVTYDLCNKIWGTEVKDEDVEPTKKSKSQQIWSKKDEIVILEGLVEFKKKGYAPLRADMPEFQSFIQKSVCFEFSQRQLTDKIRRLKWKYKNMRNTNKGRDPVFTKPHKKSAYNLWKMIWDAEDNYEDVESMKKSQSEQVCSKKDVKKSESEQVCSKKDLEKSQSEQVCSKKDELVILKGLVEFKRKGYFPFRRTYTTKFHCFIQKYVSFKCSQEQLSKKIHRLKRKYKKMRTINNGEDPVFTKPHEENAYNLWKMIWGAEDKDDDERACEEVAIPAGV